MTDDSEPTLASLRDELRALSRSLHDQLAIMRTGANGNTFTLTRLAGILAAHDERLCALDGKETDLPPMTPP